MVRYRDSQVVSTKGERYTEIKKKEDEELLKKTQVSLKPAKQYRFHWHLWFRRGIGWGVAESAEPPGLNRQWCQWVGTATARVSWRSVMLHKRANVCIGREERQKWKEAKFEPFAEVSSTGRCANRVCYVASASEFARCHWMTWTRSKSTSRHGHVVYSWLWDQNFRGRKNVLRLFISAASFSALSSSGTFSLSLVHFLEFQGVWGGPALSNWPSPDPLGGWDPVFADLRWCRHVYCNWYKVSGCAGVPSVANSYSGTRGWGWPLPPSLPCCHHHCHHQQTSHLAKMRFDNCWFFLTLSNHGCGVIVLVHNPPEISEDFQKSDCTIEPPCSMPRALLLDFAGHRSYSRILNGIQATSDSRILNWIVDGCLFTATSCWQVTVYFGRQHIFSLLVWCTRMHFIIEISTLPPDVRTRIAWAFISCVLSTINFQLVQLKMRRLPCSLISLAAASQSFLFFLKRPEHPDFETKWRATRYRFLNVHCASFFENISGD